VTVELETLAQHRLLAYDELAMSRRKGETTGAMNERDPLAVHLIAPL
jgi:hypothetical protein